MPARWADLGARVRRARERGPRARARGVLSQASAGELIDKSRGWWQLLEAGRLSPQICDLEMVANLLWVNVPYLLGLEAGKLSGEVGSAERRVFLSGLVGVAGAAAVGPVDLERLASPMVDSAYLRDAEMVTVSLMQSWRTMSPAALLPAASAHLGALRTLMPGPCALASLVGRTAVLVGYLESKLGQRGSAWGTYALAAAAADEASDETARTLALSGQASMHSRVAWGARQGNPDMALRLWNMAVDSAPSWRRPVALANRAEERAGLGDADGAQADVEAAESEMAGWPHDQSVYFGARNEVELSAYRGNVELLMGRNREAVVTLDMTLTRMDPKLISWRAAVLADQGAAYARARDVDAAIDRLERALQLARQAGDQVDRVRGVRQRDLSGWADEPVVKRLDERLATA